MNAPLHTHLCHRMLEFMCALLQNQYKGANCAQRFGATLHDANATATFCRELMQ